MQRLLLKLAAIPALLALSGCVGEIPFVGLDANGKEIETLVPSNRYLKQVSYGIGDMTQSAIPAVDGQEARYMVGLRELELGLALDGSVPVGVVQLTGSIGYEMIFSN